jgi:amino acid transporter
LDQSEEQSHGVLSALERALHHLMAAGRKYASEMMSTLVKRAKGWLVWIIIGLGVGLLALIGLVFLLVGAAELIESAFGLFAGAGYLIMGAVLIALFLLFLAIAGGRGKKK